MFRFGFARRYEYLYGEEGYRYVRGRRRMFGRYELQRVRLIWPFYFMLGQPFQASPIDFFRRSMGRLHGEQFEIAKFGDWER